MIQKRSWVPKKTQKCIVRPFEEIFFFKLSFQRAKVVTIRVTEATLTCLARKITTCSSITKIIELTILDALDIELELRPAKTRRKLFL